MVFDEASFYKKRSFEYLKKNAHELDDVLTFRVNTDLKKNLVEFVRRTSLPQVLSLTLYAQNC